MIWLKTLRARLLATYLGLIILGFGGLTLLAGWQIATNAYTDFANTLEINAVLLASNLAMPLHESSEHGLSPSVVDSVRKTADGLNLRVLLLNQSGAVILDSASPSLQPTRPQGFALERSLREQTGYFFALDNAGAKQLVVTAPLRSEERSVGYLQLVAPADQPRAMVRQRWLALGIGFLLFAIVGLIVSLWLLATLTKPLKRLRTTALAMAAGDLTQRVPQPGNDEIGAVGNAFNQMATEVEAMVAEQRAFAGNASHELRTPLTTLRLRTEAILSGDLDPATTRQYIGEIDREVTHMSGLVDDLILLSRLDAHRLAVGEEQVDVARVVRSVHRELAPLIADNGLTVIVEDPPTPLPPVQANLNHLRVVVRNLVENGVKYTPTGGVIVISLAAEDGASGRQICCQVRDNGAGIAADELPHVHKRFHRAALARQRQPTGNNSRQREQSDGAGLGLALVDSIVTLYGGRFAINSPGLNLGTTVTVWWPVAQEAV